MRNVLVVLSIAVCAAFATLSSTTAEAAGYRRSAPVFVPRMHSAPRYIPQQRYIAPRYVPRQRYIAPRYVPRHRYVAPRSGARHAVVRPNPRSHKWPGMIRERLPRHRIPHYHVATWATTGFVAGGGAYYYFAVPDEAVLLPSGPENDAPAFDTENFIRSLGDDGSAPAHEQVPPPGREAPEGSLDGKPWASLTIDNDGKVFSRVSPDSAEDVMLVTHFACQAESKLKKTCKGVVLQGWLVGLHCKTVRWRLGVVGSGWTAKEAIVEAYRRALGDGTFDKSDCKMIARLAADGSHTKYAPTPESE